MSEGIFLLSVVTSEATRLTPTSPIVANVYDLTAMPKHVRIDLIANTISSEKENSAVEIRRGIVAIAQGLADADGTIYQPRQHRQPSIAGTVIALNWYPEGFLYLEVSSVMQKAFAKAQRKRQAGGAAGNGVNRATKGRKQMEKAMVKDRPGIR